MRLLATVTGRVLRIVQQSEGVVAAGTPLVEGGDPQDLEIVADLLSADAVRVEPGQRVVVEGWGGEKPLAGRVRLVEPFGFTKVSALGIEEQRVTLATGSRMACASDHAVRDVPLIRAGAGTAPRSW